MKKRHGGMAYTRQKYIHSIPQSKIRLFTLGDKKGDYTHVIRLRATRPVEIGSAALEAARVTANKILQTSGNAYLFKILVFPHEIVREHKFMGFAGADRLSQGMGRAFGRSKSRTARVNTKQSVLAVSTTSDGIDVAKTALKRASKKLPPPYTLDIEEIEGQT